MSGSPKRHAGRSVAARALIALALCGCSAASTDGKTFGGGLGGAGGSAGGGGGSGGAGGSLFDAGALDDGGGVPTCAAATQFVYVITAASELYKFDPPTVAFTKVGTLDCAGPLATPYSMSVDRVGTAWSVFTDGTLVKIDTSNAKCTPTAFAPGQSGFFTFGMGFSANAPGSADETLYVSNSVGGAERLGMIDLATMHLTPLAAYDALHARAELTGTGDARLFGAFEGAPYVVAEIEKATSHIASQAPQTAINYAPSSSNFAFAAWGGDFWLFVGPGSSTDVFQYQPASGQTTKRKSVSFEIVGAGVSTCAPYAQPH